MTMSRNPRTRLQAAQRTPILPFGSGASLNEVLKQPLLRQPVTTVTSRRGRINLLPIIFIVY